MRADGSLHSLLQGVSQQPARNRLPGQCSLQENMTSNPVLGLSRRAPMEYIKAMYSTSATVQFYELDYGAGHEYILAASAGSLRAFDLTGVEHTITDSAYAGSFSYISGAQLAVETLKDNVTYIADTERVTLMQSTLPTYMNYNSFVTLLGGAYSRNYTISVRWRENTPTGTERVISATWGTPDGTNPTHTAMIATDYIATQLVLALQAVATYSFNSKFSIVQAADTIYIQWDAGGSPGRTDKFSVTCKDGDSNTTIVACNNQVQSISQLPLWAVQGYFVTVTGDKSSAGDDYYLQFVIPKDAAGVAPGLNGGFSQEGVWTECVKDTVKYKLDTNTMPHTLTYDSTARTFVFNKGTWADRQVGDDTSCPIPSCIGNTISDISFFQSRLVLLSGANVILSRTNKPLDLFFKSGTVSTDSDVIDISSTAKGVRKMLRAIPHNRDLIVFSDAGQFIVFGRNALTPKNSSLVLTTKFEAELTYAKPVSDGHNIAFAINYGNYTGIREFFTEVAQDSNDSRPTTQQVLKYIPKTAAELAVSSNFNILLVRATIDTNSIYVYEYIWENQNKVQSSWSKWTFTKPIVMMFFKESSIYVIQKNGNEYSLCVLGLELQDDTDVGYNVKLDNKISKTGIHKTISSLYTTYPVTYDKLIFVQGTGCPNPGLRVELESYNSGTGVVTLKKDMLGGTVIIGHPYTSKYQPTVPFAKDQDGVKIDSARLIVSKFFVSVKESGGFLTRIFSKYREDATVNYTGLILGDPDITIGSAPIASYVYKVPFKDSTDHTELEISNSTHLPLTILNIDWVGQYTKRGKRIATGG